MELDRKSRAHREFVALLLGGAGFLIGALLGWFILGDNNPMFGRGSVGELSTAMAPVLGGGAFLLMLAFSRSDVLPWLDDLSAPRRVFNVIGMTMLYAILAVMVSALSFYVFQYAFRGIRFDEIASAFIVGVAGAVVAYAAATSTAHMSAGYLSMLTGIFMVSGTLLAAITASSSSWWQIHFSALGTVRDLSGVSFNLTVIMAGVLIAALADALAYDLRRVATDYEVRQGRVNVVHGMFVAMGWCLAGVGIIPVSVSLEGHNLATYAAVGIFVTVMILMLVYFKRLRRTFSGPTIFLGLVLAAAGYLFQVQGSLNITAFEMLAMGLVMVWMILLVRNIESQAAGIEDSDPFQLSVEERRELREKRRERIEHEPDHIGAFMLDREQVEEEADEAEDEAHAEAVAR